MVAVRSSRICVLVLLFLEVAVKGVSRDKWRWGAEEEEEVHVGVVSFVNEDFEVLLYHDFVQ